MYISIIIPAYNEEKRIGRTLNSIINYLKKKEYSSEIIVVSDGSIDNTKIIVRTVQDKYQNLVFIEYFPNRGKGFAVKKGMSIAKGKFRLFMDADYSVPIEYLDTFLSLINYNCDIVIGSRGLKQSQIETHQSFIRELAAKIFGVIQRVILRLPFIDTQCGFKLFTKESAEILFPLITFSCAYFDAELLYIAYHSKMNIGEIGVRWKHDGETRLPIGIIRILDLVKKLFMIKRLHRVC